MLFWEKIEHVWETHHKAQSGKEEALEQLYGSEEKKLEKGDLPAMLISAFLVIVPAVLAALLALVGIPYLLFLH